MSQFQPFRLLLAASLLAFTAILGSLLSGSVDLSFSDLMSYVLGDLPDLQRQVFEDIRLPRTLAAFVTGAALALAGVLMQVLLRNPLADPYILGLSGGAAVGALASIMLGLGGWWLSSTAFVGALISVGVVFGIASRAGSWSTTHLLLTGVVVSAGWGALINLMLSTSASASVQGMLFWLMGDLSQSSVGPAQIGVLVVGAALAMRAARSLNVLVRGDLVAASLGVDIKRLRLSLFFGASLLTVIAVTTAGSVGFVGLVVPHMLRLIGARDHRVLIPFSLLTGGTFLVVADTLARTLLAPQQLPVGVITALIGVPSFIAILRSTPSK
ncbi:MAG: iron ABC transporter permease [Gammaproteobacteria bacterium]|uniref:ABC transporter permease n=4 Tax=OM182 clade TaxID=745002 RepID=A0A0R2S9P6_9GAMM|nr:MAG: ABC transporter permease [OM182 bacterium BACL3 MAG-120507-bin80]KRO82446.1 MAG: ABC transporter permease [OM182 bacterium BACL3 MAG-120619-bin3]KRP28210.1 MAG: ABC transporter permease [OM182 bacterium BACL3 MAG-120924-bin41]MBT3522403.1 iron ABC transporter permease [Gammaproteobacteria bacterium]MDP4770279.1 iron ABC transporter permease [OM182 bacterium]